jgi:hypothetical protein
MRPPSGSVLETTALIDAIIMTSEKKKGEKQLRTLSFAVAILLGPRIVYVFFFGTHINTH